MKDMKEGLTSGRKADTTHARKSLRVYIARACEYGSAKYERANYVRPAGGTKENFERLRKYLRAAVDHIEDTLTSMERHQADDPNLMDEEGMKRAAYAEDTDAKPGCPVGASGLPHLCHAAASLMMAIEQATHYGLLPADPGQPWAERKKVKEFDATVEADGYVTAYVTPATPPPLKQYRLKNPGANVESHPKVVFGPSDPGLGCRFCQGSAFWFAETYEEIKPEDPGYPGGVDL